MDFVIHIPTWLAWVAGFIGCIAVLTLASLGVATVVALARFKLW